MAITGVVNRVHWSGSGEVRAVGVHSREVRAVRVASREVPAGLRIRRSVWQQTAGRERLGRRDVHLKRTLWAALLACLLFVPHSPAQAQQRQKFPEGSQITLVALMVEFQPDTNRFTSGNGTFEPGSIPYLEDPGTRIDPLPHDRGYFASHLAFATTYFQSQSGGRITFHTHVLSKVVRLPHSMEAYSPVGEDPSLSPLAGMVRDAWTQVGRDRELVEEINSLDLDPARTGFILFHAGIGRDIELTGTILEKTPQDLPSVFLDQVQLSLLLGQPQFDGFDVYGTSLKVDNALIVPRTESRSGTDLMGQTFVLPLSMNGMLTAQIGSFLGLPDLFDTRTGQSGIGRFGLMDGAGIFALNGLFPPRLSAFERVWLGWDSPLRVDPGAMAADSSLVVELAAVGTDQVADVPVPTILKVPVTGSEYFLLENRHRDPDGQGVELTFTLADGSTETVRFTNRDDAFLRMDLGVDTLLPRGVLTGVSNYDFALHGGLDVGEDGQPDTEDDRQLNGGILIWHIDESVMERVAERNAAIAGSGDSTARFSGFNDLPWRRAVDLEEADGAQDIGYSTSLGFTSIDPTGSAFDFWWEGNDARVITASQEISLYSNTFDGQSTPDNRTQGGAPSWFKLDSFSGNQSMASLRVTPVRSSKGGQVQRLFSSSLPDRFGGWWGAFDEDEGAGPGKGAGSVDDPGTWSSVGLPSLPRLLPDLDGRSDIVVAGQDSVWLVDAEGSIMGIAPGRVQSPILLHDRIVLVSQPSVSGEGADLSTVDLRVMDRVPGPERFQTRFTLTLPANRLPLSLDALGRVNAPLRGWRVDPSAPNGQLALVEQASEPGEEHLLTPTLHGYRLLWDAAGLSVLQESSETPIARFAFDPVQNLLTGRRGWVGAVETEKDVAGFFVLNGNSLHLIEEPFKQIITLSAAVGSQLPSFGDVDADGRVDAVYIGSRESSGELTLNVTGRRGAALPGFPRTLSDAFSAPETISEQTLGQGLPSRIDPSGSVLLANLTNNPGLELLVPIRDNGSHSIRVLASDGTLLPEWSASLGGEASLLKSGFFSSVRTEPGSGVLLASDTLLTISPSGDLQMFRFSGHTSTVWASALGPDPDAAPRLLVGGQGYSASGYGLLNSSEVYNWPNPAFDQTSIRFETSVSCDVRIDVITPSGRRVWSRAMTSIGGAAEEVTVETMDWSSGAYIVRVQASHDGKTESKLFNMAVVR